MGIVEGYGAKVRREGVEAEDVFYHRKKKPVANVDPPPMLFVFLWVGEFPPQLFCNQPFFSVFLLLGWKFTHLGII